MLIVNFKNLNSSRLPTEILINTTTTLDDDFAVLQVLDIMVRVPGMVKQMTGVDVTNVRRGTSVY